MNPYKKSICHTKDIKLPNEEIKKIVVNHAYLKSIQQVENSDVDINHLENIFTDKSYYLAMKIVPLLERKVLYLSYVENIRLNDICRKLKLSKTQVISLRNNAINHFKHNLDTLYKIDKLKKGGNC